MIIGKQNLLLSMRIFSTIILVFLSSIFFQVLNYDNNKSSKIKQLEIIFENKLSCLNYTVNSIFWNLEDNFKCNEIKADFGVFYPLSENRYVFYSFALFIGAVFNLKKIIKVGVF